MNLRGSPEFVFLKSFLQEETKNMQVFFLENPWNFWDALIRTATLNFLKDAWISHRNVQLFRFLNMKSFFLSYLFFFYQLIFIRNKILLVCGSGAWCKYWTYLRRKIKIFQFFFNKIIILPTTFGLPSISRAKCFARDKFDSMQTVPDAIFCHDLAFYLDVKTRKKWSGTGLFFREDKEALHDTSLLNWNRDLSQEWDEKSDINVFLEVIDEFETIKTDRLHVAIWWILLDKKVDFYSNAYFKNKSVYFSSMKNTGVTFFDSLYLR